MRLYLSSFRLGNNPDKLLDMLGDNRRAAIVMNAIDFNAQEERDAKFEQETQALNSIGVESAEIDLRNYFDNKDELEEDLKKFDMLWIRGGNVFILRRAMQESGFDSIIKEMLAQDRLVYAGYSAAICVLAPTLKGFSIVDDPDLVANGYDQAIIWEGLGILDYSIEPHYKSNHPESQDIDKEIAYLEKHNIPYRTLHDGEALVINGDVEEVVGA